MTLVQQTLGPHATFILIAYAVVTTVVAALVVWVIVDYRSQQATLRRLDAEGVSRRSARKAKDRA